MRLSRHNKYLLFEQEFLALILVIILGFAFYKMKNNFMFYLTVLLIGLALYFWMLYEEKVFKTGKKHNYFDYTSSYLVISQTTLVLSFFFGKLSAVNIEFLAIIFLVISVIMYSVSLSRIILYKAVFKK